LLTPWSLFHAVQRIAFIAPARPSSPSGAEGLHELRYSLISGDARPVFVFPGVCAHALTQFGPDGEQVKDLLLSQ
jgi:hypothetical protein